MEEHEARNLEEIRERESQQLNGLCITIFKESRVFKPIISMMVAVMQMNPT